MRDQGRLVEWFDEKGYGFIQPDDAEKERVFCISKILHALTSANYWLCTGISGNP